MTNGAKSGSVPVKEFKLYYEIHGADESKATLLALHGGPGFTHH
jgi:hypothetical protein